MTDFQTGPSMPPPVDVPVIDAKPRWSLIAIAGFILSFLFLAAPLGIVLGIFGIFRTRGQRRRGMGLAIAAIPIGVIVSLLTGMFVLSVVMFARMNEVGADVASCWKTTRSEVPQRAGSLYDNCSKRFQQAVTREAFLSWAAGVAEKHGSLQRTKLGTTPIEPNEAGESVLNLVGEFVNGPANITVTLGWPGLTPEVDDVSVDGVSPKSRNPDRENK